MRCCAQSLLVPIGLPFFPHLFLILCCLKEEAVAEHESRFNLGKKLKEGFSDWHIMEGTVGQGTSWGIWSNPVVMKQRLGGGLGTRFGRSCDPRSILRVKEDFKLLKSAF